MPAPVIDALHAHIDLEAVRGGYEAAADMAGAVECAYSAVAALLGADADAIAIVENATVAWCQAFYGIAESLQPGDVVLTAEAEYASNYMAFLQVQKRRGIEIRVAPSNAYGELDLEAFARLLDARVKLIAITHIPTNGGLINPVAEVGKLAREADVPYLLDACQAAGQVELDVDEIGCDFLTATGRKFLRAPRGTGFLYVRPEMLERFEPGVIDLRAAVWTAEQQYQLVENARRYENWETNIAAKIGLGVAVDYALGWGMHAVSEQLAAVAEQLRSRLSQLTGVQLMDQGRQKGAIVTFDIAGVDPVQARAALAEQGFNLSVTDIGSTRLDMQRRGLESLLRASVHYTTSAEELDALTRAVETLAQRRGV